MGLDMYAYRAPASAFRNPQASVDLEWVEPEAYKARTDLAYWRKFNALHGWMEDLYRAREGADSDFNCAKLRLDPADLDQLERDIASDQLRPRSGFFFGSQDIHPDDLASIPPFIAKAREAIAAGDVVFYDSWW